MNLVNHVNLISFLTNLIISPLQIETDKKDMFNNRHGERPVSWALSGETISFTQILLNDFVVGLIVMQEEKYSAELILASLISKTHVAPFTAQ